MSETAEKLERVRVATLDEILGKSFKVLDDGFVRVVDYMGDDSAIVQAARVSYGKGTKKVNEDRGLIRYLLRHWHTTPFEMCEIKLHVRVPMDCWRQWIRHRTANVNEYSTRYSVAIDAMQRTPPDQWRVQSKDSKQGSAGNLEPQKGAEFSESERLLQEHTRGLYEQRLAAGIAREQARKDLPLSTYTEAYWKVDLHNLLHFLRLRMDAHAQLEIREYADAIGKEIVRRWCPIAWEAFLDYQFNSQSFSRLELEMIEAIGAGKQDEALRLASDFGWLSKDDEGELKRNRERAELEVKLRKFHLKIPWGKQKNGQKAEGGRQKADKTP